MRSIVPDFIKSFNWRDPIERVFGIVSIGSLIAFIVLFFYDPGEILGMARGSFALMAFLGFMGSYLGLKVVRWFRKRDE